MKTEILTILFLLGASGSGQLLAQETDRQSQRPRPSREQMQERLLQHYDTDGDGVLSKQERQVARAERQAQRQLRSGQLEGERKQGRRGQAEGERAQGRRGKIEGERKQGRRGQVEGQQFQPRRGSAGGEQLQAQGRSRGQEQKAERPNRKRQGLESRRQGQGQLQQRPARGRDQAQGQQRPTREQRRVQIMQHFDANGDGKLDEYERAALKEAAQKRRAQLEGERPNREAKSGRGRQERESANAPRSDRRQFPR